MEFVSISSNSLGEFGSLSPELWIASKFASKVREGTPLNEIVYIASETSKPNAERSLVLDTGNANNGLLNIRMYEVGAKRRISAKKLFQEGDILISRLRPYLRQVVFIPKGSFKVLSVERGFCSTEFFVLRPKKNENIAYLVKWLLSNEVQKMIGGAATGGHHPRFDKSLLMNSYVPKKYQSTEASKLISEISIEYLKIQMKMKNFLRH